MNESFHAVEAARKWRARVSYDVAGMSPRQKTAYFQRFESVDVLKAEAVPTKNLPVVTTSRRKNSFDAVKESRKWKAGAARKRQLARAA